MIMCILMCIRAKKCDYIIRSFMFACISFGGSSFEDYESPFDTFTFRPLSKGLFAAIFIVFSVFYGTSVSPQIFDNGSMTINNTNFSDVSDSSNLFNNTDVTKNNTVFEPSDCSILCQGNRNDEDQKNFLHYCNNLW